MSEEDPVSDFLKREQEDMAGLDDETPPAADLAPPDQAKVAPPRPSPPGSVKSTSSEPKEPRPVPEKIRLWQEEQKKRLENKDAEETKKISAMKAAAAKELAEFHSARKETLEKARSANRKKEKEDVAQRDLDLKSSGKKEGSWERITALCEFNPKSVKNLKDVSRLRSLLLQMKQGENAA